MRPLSLGALSEVLVVGAHSDDIEIGCGGTLLRLARENPDCRFTWLVLTGDDVRRGEAAASAAAFFPDGRAPELITPGLRDGHLPLALAEVKAAFESAKTRCSPDLVLTHQRGDLHQDHRVCAEVALQTFRDHRILEYEIPKYDGDMGAPNAFVVLDPELVERKVDHLMEHFASQRSKRWFTRDLFAGLMRIRGVEAGADGGFAEGFYMRKAVLG